MKKHIRKIKYILLIIAVLLIVSAIYNIKLRGESVTQSSENDGKKVVVMWLKASPIGTTLQYQVNKFNDENTDNIFIDLKIYHEDYDNLLTTAMACDQGPDIFQYTDYDLIKSDHILDLSKLDIDNKIIGKNDYIYYNNIPVGTKYSDDTVKLLINKDILKESGIKTDNINTWQDILRICKELKENNKDIIPFGFQYSTYQSLLGSFGAASIGENNIYSSFYNYKTGKYDYSQIENILSIYAYMYKNGYIPEDFDKLDADKLRYEFYSGSIAMMIGSYQDKALFSTNLSVPFAMMVFPIPSSTGDHKKEFIVSDSNFLCVNNDILNSDKMEAVKSVYSWFFSQDNLTQLFKTKQILPSILKKRDNEEDNYNIFNVKLEEEKNDPTPFIPLDITDIKVLITNSIKNGETINKNLNSIVKIIEDNFNLRIKQSNLDIKYYIKQD